LVFKNEFCVQIRALGSVYAFCLKAWGLTLSLCLDEEALVNTAFAIENDQSLKEHHLFMKVMRDCVIS